METDMPSTSSQPMSSDIAPDRPIVGMNQITRTLASSTPPPQSSDINREASTQEESTVRRHVVPDLPSLCFPLINAASLQPIDLSLHLPVSRIGAAGPNNRCKVHGGANFPGSWEEARANRGLVSCRSSTYKLRMTRKNFFYKTCQRHWFDERKLVAAVQSLDAGRVIQLLESGASPNVCDQKLRTPLHVAVSQGQDYIASLLLAKKADPNRQDILGNAPLHLAVCRGDRQTVKVLIEYGADIFATDHYGRTPLSLVKSRLGAIRRDQKLTTDKMKSEFMLISDFLHARARRMAKPDETSMDDLCQMMQTVSTREQADEIADAVFQKMADISIKNVEKPKPAQTLSSFHAIL